MARLLGPIFRHLRGTGQVDGDVELLIRKRMGQLEQRMHNIGALSGAWNLHLPDGSVAKIHINKHAGQTLRAYKLDIAESGGGVLDARYVWLPEGFVITPKTSEVTYGFGFPKYDAAGVAIDPPYGTPDGPFRECLLNKYAGNKYVPNTLYHNLVYHTIAYTEEGFDLPGLFLSSGRVDTLQFESNGRFESNLVFPYEVPTATWRAHFPEEARYTDRILARIAQRVAELRENVGRDPLFNPPRGFYDASAVTVAELALTNVIAHDSEDHREGYEQGRSRWAKDRGWIGAAENLAYVPTELLPATPELIGDYLFEGWKNSPDHYAAMIAEDWDLDYEDWVYDPPYSTTPVDEVYHADATILQLGHKDSATGKMAAQTFMKDAQWVQFGNQYWEGEEGRVSWILADPHKETNPHAVFRVNKDDLSPVKIPKGQTVMEQIDGAGTPAQSITYLIEDYTQDKPAVFLHGRYYRLKDANVQTTLILGAGLRRTSEWDSKSRLYLVVAVLRRETRKLDFEYVAAEELGRYDTNDEIIPWTNYATFSLDDYFNISTVRFSQDGNKAIFKAEKFEGNPVIERCGTAFSVTAPYQDWDPPEEEKDALIGEFWQQEDGLFALMERTTGITISGFDRGYNGGPKENFYKYSANGACSVAKDYKDNEVVTLRAVVRDRFEYVESPGVYEPEFDLFRELVFPSGKRFVYHEHKDFGLVTLKEGIITSIDYINLQTEDIGGVRLRYNTKVDTLQGVDVIAPHGFVAELFLNSTVLDTYSDWPTDPFPVADVSILDDMPTMDSIGQFWFRRHLIAEIKSGPSTPYYYSPDGFVPYPLPFDNSYRTIGGTTYTFQNVNPPAEQRVDYGSKMLPVQRSFAYVRGTSSGFQVTHPGDSYIQRAWSLRGTIGLYAPMPWFGDTGAFHCFDYEGKSLKGGHNRKCYFMNYGTFNGSWYEYPGPVLTDTALAEKDLAGYETELALDGMTGLELTDDIFPIGLI